ncbi:RNA polymerase sigma factor [Desulfosporosinus youngiae]|uniref:RNA polymerase sigma factor, sigma-70 family n=1 Tax=Desulfosporosinus youngiae DSM 17734 TaxID=768710 RepID=H5XWG8_9FIRM|nr:RNA polymerase sigma factor [Desulfosporosinus youngiae]EHQ90337.1 RNA polymerase sigma factor, sigma-70 family [Desulfosporosinus youngiae DSM 17734]
MTTKKSSFNEYGMETWYQQTVKKLYSFTYSLLQNREEAEDITQETYFRCLRRDTKSFPPYPYLKKVARNLIYDRYRHWQKIGSQMDDHSLTEDVSATEENWETRALVQELMNQLPEQYRQVLELRIIEGYSRKETAERMERSEDAIRGLQYRALQALRDLFKAADGNGG